MLETKKEIKINLVEEDLWEINEMASLDHASKYPLAKFNKYIRSWKHKRFNSAVRHICNKFLLIDCFIYLGDNVKYFLIYILLIQAFHYSCVPFCAEYRDSIGDRITITH